MNSFGTLFRVTLWGESHGAQVGVTIDGVTAGLPLNAFAIASVIFSPRSRK